MLVRLAAVEERFVAKTVVRRLKSQTAGLLGLGMGILRSLQISCASALQVDDRVVIDFT